MKLGLHTYRLNLHGIGQAWAGFKLIGTAVGEGDIDMRSLPRWIRSNAASATAGRRWGSDRRPTRE
jgi:alpha/beta superfamily hydrolase